MSVLTERVRAALAPDYELLEDIAAGGMGVVYKARDVALDRVVAVKIIRPELATATAAERFLREARALAAFSHPNIVPVYRAAESGGLSYYVMEWVEGESLAARLERGPLAPDAALRVADDLLAALEAVHGRGLIHRDIKPQNIFLAGGRARLGDFGIAKTATAGGDTSLTATGASPGTPGYMPPEQHQAGECTPATDICAAAMVIYEALTGRRWVFDAASPRADWTGVPRAAVAPLRRALAWSPHERWARAADFRAALHHRATPRRAAVAVLLLVAGVVAWTLWPAKGSGMLRVRLQPLVASDRSSGPLADSLTTLVLRSLQGAADMVIDTGAASAADLTVSGTLSSSGDSAHVTLRGTSTSGSGVAFQRNVSGTRAGLADNVALQLLGALWESRDPAFHDLPVKALPSSPAGMLMWRQAEALYARGLWPQAYRAFEAAGRDSSCALCDLRLTTITRWLRIETDTSVSHRVARAGPSFPEHYRAIIRASMSGRDRWAELSQLVSRYPRFDLGHFVYGDELFHRGPLAGHRRSLALDQFQELVLLHPGFAPGWEHLAWVAIAEGNEPVAASALRQFVALAPSDDESALKRALLTVGAAWRFKSPEEAAATTEYILGQPLIDGLSDLRWGANYLLVFDAPLGVVWLGRRFAGWTAKPELHTPGLVAQIVGYRALGLEDSARAVTGRLRGELGDLELALAAAEFDASPALFDSATAAAAWPALERELGPLARLDDATPLQRGRAAWMLALVAGRAGRSDQPWRALVRGPALAPFATLLDADSLARRAPRAGLLRSQALLDLDSAGRAGDPFFRSALHLLRAEWYTREGNPAAAQRELLWSGNYDIVGHPASVVQAENADWSLGTLARWRRATLAPDGAGRDLCRDLEDVARLWAGGDPVFRARADSARARHARLRCATP